MTGTEKTTSEAGSVLRRSLTGTQDGATAGGVLVLTIDNPPLNGLTHPVRTALSAALTEAAAESPPRPVVICGAAGAFSAATLVEAGAQIRDLAPSLASLCQQIDDFPAPVVAAIAGRAAGPGAELALACHGRVMSVSARILFPEAGLGLPPMAGSSQRLPRLTGAKEALSLILNARPVSGDQALAIGLADHVTEEDPLSAAIELTQMMKMPHPVIARDDGLRDVAAFSAAIARARRDEARNPMPAPARIIDCIEAALYLPPENGFALEAVCFEDLAQTSESQGLIAAARAGRAAHILPAAVAAGPAEEIRVLGLTGVGPQLAALALLALGRGMRVIWVGPEAGCDVDAHLKITAWVRERIEAETRSGRLSPAQRDSDLLRFETGQSVAALGQAGLIVHGRAGASVDTIARHYPAVSHLVIGGASGRAGLTIAPSGKVCEISTGAVIGPQALAAIWRLMRDLGLQPVLSGGWPQIGRQVAATGKASLGRLQAMGVPRRLIVTALEGFGQAMPDISETNVEAGQTMRGMAAEEVVQRWLGAMANEGYRLIAEGAAASEMAIDFVLVQGHDFPRWRGGPMHQAAKRGAMVLRSDLRRWQGDDPLWTPHPALDLLVSKGRGGIAA